MSRYWQDRLYLHDHLKSNVYREVNNNIDKLVLRKMKELISEI